MPIVTRSAPLIGHLLLHLARSVFFYTVNQSIAFLSQYDVAKVYEDEKSWLSSSSNPRNFNKRHQDHTPRATIRLPSLFLTMDGRMENVNSWTTFLLVLFETFLSLQMTVRFCMAYLHVISTRQFPLLVISDTKLLLLMGSIFD